MPAPVTDPFAAIAQPIQQAAPSTTAAGTATQQQDPFAAIAQPISGGQQPSTTEGIKAGSYTMPGTGGADDPMAALSSGFYKSAKQMLGSVLDLVHGTYVEPLPGVMPGAGTGQADPAAAKRADHLKDAADWLHKDSQPEGFWENVGAVGEQVLEYLGTDGLLKLVGPGAKVASTAGRVAETAEQLRQAQQTAATLSKNTKLAGLVAIGLKAAKDATMMGAQTLGHTEDPVQALEGAALGGALGAAGGTAGRLLERIRPKTVEIAGEEIPALAGQLNEAGVPNGNAAGGAPKIEAAQQAAAQRVIQNTARQALVRSVDGINATRSATTPISDTARMLAAPEGAAPYTFTLEGTGTAEGTTGEIAHPAAKAQQAAFKQPRFTTSSAERPTVEGTEGTTGSDVATSTPRQAAEDVAAGGGTLKTTNPREAAAWLQQLEEIQQSPVHGSLSEGQQKAIETQRQSLEQQLGLYHASPYAQRFAPVDAVGAADQVRTLGDAATQIQEAVKPVYQTLDRVSGGAFNKWNNAAKQAQKIMRSATSLDAAEAAQQRYEEATGQINDLITRHASDISRGDFAAAKQAWRDSSRLNELHGVFERMMNGITAEESEQGLSRVMTGRTRMLEAYLEKGTNREQIGKLIGDEGVRNLKQLTQLMSKADTARATSGVLKNVVMYLGKHPGGVGGLVGGAAAHAMGVSPWYGMSAGAGVAEGMRMVMREAATNPRVGNMVDWAARNGLDSRHYAPLIARAIAAPLEEQPEKQEEEGGPQ